RPARGSRRALPAPGTQFMKAHSILESTRAALPHVAESTRAIMPRVAQSTRAVMPRVVAPFRRAEPPSPLVSRYAARALGCFSIFLGAMELAAPARLAALLGLDGKEGLLRAYGSREVAAGIAVLAGFLAPAMWARVVGDLIDIATLAVGRRTD